MANILVVDDDLNILEVIQTRLEASGHNVEAHADPREALASLQEKDFDAILTDVRMPHLDGMEFLDRVRSLRWDIPVILLTAYGTIPSAVEAIKKGAFQYLTKPFQGKQLVEVLQAAIEERGGRRSVGDGLFFPGVFGASPAIQALVPFLERIIQSDSMVLIQGESGTGKELFAEMIHYNGSRKNNRFVIMDCGATPGSLIESELFGHAKGSFTNATDIRKGLFEVADKGTLFLDEIGSMPLDLQTRLLRALQEGEIKRVGENLMREVDVRVIAATNRDLKELVNQGGFRLDLYYRLAVLRVDLPPLRERREDIPLLARTFLESFSRRMKREPMELTDRALAALAAHHWPGNIRELKNVIEAATVLARGRVLEPEDLALAGLPGTPEWPALAEGGKRGPASLSLPEYLMAQERELIVQALRENRWVQKDAARQLGISPRVMSYKIGRLKIQVPASDAEGGAAEDPSANGDQGR